MVQCPVGTTESFKVKVRLHQGSALSSFLFTLIMDRLTDEVRREPLLTILFDDDIVICEETREEVEQSLKCGGMSRDGQFRIIYYSRIEPNPEYRILFSAISTINIKAFIYYKFTTTKTQSEHKFIAVQYI